MKKNKKAKRLAKLNRKEVCPSCGGLFGSLTKHHVLPKRWFGWKNNDTTVKLCADCHNKLERRIFDAEHGHQHKLTKSHYWKILMTFLKAGVALAILYLLTK